MSRATASRADGETPSRWPVSLICGDDEFSVKQRARTLWNTWTAEAGGMDQEVLEATAGTVDEALNRIGRLREALQTLPFFGGTKLIWFRDCSFLGEDRTGKSTTVTEALSGLVEEWKTFPWEGVRLLISAGKPDKRRTFFKTLEKQATVEFFASLAEDKDWADRVGSEALRLLRSAKKAIADEALTELVGRVGPHLRSLNNEVEKLVVHAGDREEITLADVELLTPLQKLAESFALGEAVGERNLIRALQVLDEELWTIRTRVDKRKSEIGLVYGMLAKIRVLLIVKELRRIGRLKPVRDFPSFRSQAALLDPAQLPSAREFNPFAGNPYPAFKALHQCDRWESAELVRAMELLLEANVQLVASGQDEAVVLQRALVEIVGPGRSAAVRSSDGRGG